MGKSGKTLFDQLREEAEASSARRSVSTSIYLRWIIIICSCVVLALLLPGNGGHKDRGVYDQTLLGTTWTNERVIAEYAFSVPKPPSVLQAQREAARRLSPVVFARSGHPVWLTKENITNAIKRQDKAFQRELLQYVDDIGTRLSDRYIVDNVRTRVKGTASIVRNDDGSETIVNATQIADKQTEIDAILLSLAITNDQAHKILKLILDTTIQSTIVFDTLATETMSADAERSVATTQEIVRRGDILVSKGQRVDEPTLARLSAYRLAQYARTSSPFSALVALGSLAHAALIISFLAMYLFLLRPASFERNGQLAFLLFLPTLTGALGWISVHIDTALPIEYLIIVPALSMVVSLLFEERTAIVATLAMSLAVGASRGDDYSIAVVLLVGGVFGIYSSRSVQSRTQIFTSIIAIIISLVVATLAIDLERGIPVSMMWPKVLLASANGILSPLITFAVIIAFERVFNVATDMRLDEFDNLNHPLLKKLNERAPGTYQHTLAVARLSEAAAVAIGANSLLTRVGALFHDIGKIEKSEYFVENQISIENKHDRLTPKKSAAIIRQHVQDGIELANEYGIPDRISKFIPMHHGTILIKHFYATAADEALLKEIAIDENDYRYPGPKPDSKESAIVMLADAVEALSRLVNTHQRNEVDAAIRSIIVDRLTDGQLNNTPLTMNDLDVIANSFAKNLIGMSHQRIAYKGVREQSDDSV
ncbi:MAG: HDIG domain-containing protein [Ignavibacteria bacterium]|nr:HDIG domain-containing protein [Ignavibacteria bacterium]